MVFEYIFCLPWLQRYKKILRFFLFLIFDKIAFSVSNMNLLKKFFYDIYNRLGNMTTVKAFSFFNSAPLRCTVCCQKTVFET